jgi:glycosyltransferase involved in cell wall biosynthesis
VNAGAVRDVAGFCLVDPDLAGYGGHHFNYAAALERAARTRGWQYKVAGRRSAAALLSGKLPFLPFFEPRDAFRWRGHYIPLLGRFVVPWQQWRALHRIQTHEVDSRWVLQLEDVDILKPGVFHRWLSSFQPRQAPALAFMLRYSTFLPSSGQWDFELPVYQRSFRLLEHYAQTLRIRLIADTPLLTAEFQQLTKLPVFTVPTVPHIPAGASSALPPFAGKLVVGSPGVASTGKGFLVLAKAIELLHQRGELAKFHFHIQCFQRPLETVPAVTAAIERLAALPSEHVLLLKSDLDENKYYEMFAKLHLVVLPYKRDRYQASSGAFSEALFLGKPVITTEGTWMAYELRQNQQGAGLLFPEEDAEGLVQTLLSAHADYATLAAQAQERMPAWRAYHNADTYLAELVRIFAFQGLEGAHPDFPKDWKK